MDRIANSGLLSHLDAPHPRFNSVACLRLFALQYCWDTPAGQHYTPDDRRCQHAAGTVLWSEHVTMPGPALVGLAPGSEAMYAEFSSTISKI
jgi:hypothetical protein